ncbi:MAG: rhomboid family intramembrane serine protease [Sciscionella sp.]|nr:rhomboid family intramembrane serine protease [Sciscionella sp.]
MRAARATTRRATTVAGATPSRQPVIVPIMIALNVLVFGYTAYQSRSILDNYDKSALFDNWVLLPAWVSHGQWWRVLTSGFLHIGPLHIGMNMIALWLIGKDLELLLGKIRFTVVYVLSLFGGGVAVFLFGDPTSPVAGASGAVFGLMGGVAVACLRLKLNPTQALVLIAVNLIISVSIPGISLLGHVGGLVVGALATAGMVYPPPTRRIAWQFGTAVVLAAALLGLFLLRDATIGAQLGAIAG